MLDLHTGVLAEFAEAARKGRRGGSSGLKLLSHLSLTDRARCRLGPDAGSASMLSPASFDRLTKEAQLHFMARASIEAEFKKARERSRSRRCEQCSVRCSGRYCSSRCSQRAQVVILGHWPSRARNNGRGAGQPSKTSRFGERVGYWLGIEPELTAAELLRRAESGGYTGKKSAFYALVMRVRDEMRNKRAA